jgi:hypothetical protein
MDRRQFCVSGAFGLALGASSVRDALAGQPLVSRVIYDSRFGASRAFAVAAQRRGIRAVAIRGDVTALWRHDLDGHWARAGGAVAGLTTRSSLLCLEQMARDHWYQVRTRQPCADGLISWVIAA